MSQKFKSSPLLSLTLFVITTPFTGFLIILGLHNLVTNQLFKPETNLPMLTHKEIAKKLAQNSSLSEKEILESLSSKQKENQAQRPRNSVEWRGGSHYLKGNKILVANIKSQNSAFNKKTEVYVEKDTIEELPNDHIKFESLVIVRNEDDQLFNEFARKFFFFAEVDCEQMLMYKTAKQEILSGDHYGNDLARRSVGGRTIAMETPQEKVNYDPPIRIALPRANYLDNMANYVCKNYLGSP